MSSSLFNMFLAIGSIIGSLYGPNMNILVGFKTACDTVACIFFVYGLIYAIGVGCRKSTIG